MVSCRAIEAIEGILSIISSKGEQEAELRGKKKKKQVCCLFLVGREFTYRFIEVDGYDVDSNQ